MNETPTGTPKNGQPIPGAKNPSPEPNNNSTQYDLDRYMKERSPAQQSEAKDQWPFYDENPASLTDVFDENTKLSGTQPPETEELFPMEELEQLKTFEQATIPLTPHKLKPSIVQWTGNHFDRPQDFLMNMFENYMRNLSKNAAKPDINKRIYHNFEQFLQNNLPTFDCNMKEWENSTREILNNLWQRSVSDWQENGWIIDPLDERAKSNPSDDTDFKNLQAICQKAIEENPDLNEELSNPQKQKELSTEYNQHIKDIDKKSPQR